MDRLNTGRLLEAIAGFYRHRVRPRVGLSPKGCIGREEGKGDGGAENPAGHGGAEGRYETADSGASRGFDREVDRAEFHLDALRSVRDSMIKEVALELGAERTMSLLKTSWPGQVIERPKQ